MDGGIRKRMALRFYQEELQFRGPEYSLTYGDYSCPDQQKAKALLNAHKKSKHLFVFMHITPFKWTGGGVDCPDLTSQFNRHKNVRKQSLHGHDHDIDAVKTRDGIPYVFDAHVGGSWGLPYIGYRIVEVMKDGTILTYQMNAGLDKQMNSDIFAAVMRTHNLTSSRCDCLKTSLVMIR